MCIRVVFCFHSSLFLCYVFFSFLYTLLCVTINTLSEWVFIEYIEQTSEKAICPSVFVELSEWDFNSVVCVVVVVFFRSFSVFI